MHNEFYSTLNFFSLRNIATDFNGKSLKAKRFYTLQELNIAKVDKGCNSFLLPST